MLIEILSRKGVNQVLQLSNTVFGENFLDELYFNSFIGTETKKIYIAIINNEIVGFIAVEEINSQQFNKLILREELNFSAALLVIKQVAVHPLFQKKGIGYQLVSACSKKNELQKVCIAWKRTDGIPLDSALTKNGFKKIKTIFSYWHEDSIIKKYDCPECGSPCNCDAIIYKS